MNVELTIEEKVYVVELSTGQIADLSNYLSKTNTVPYIPTEDYHPATKKYVDENSGGGGGGAVNSVNGQTGTVVLDADDISDAATSNKWTNSTEKGLIATAVQPGDLSTVATSGDYNDLLNKLALGETSVTAYRGDMGKTAYDHVSTNNNPHGVTKTQVGLGNVPNTDFTSAVDANTAKVTNATHTGDVTGDTVLTIANNVVTPAKMQGTSPTSSKYYRGDGEWAVPPDTNKEQEIFGDIEVDAAVTGTKNIAVNSYASFRYSLTGTTTLTESGTPASGKSCVRTFIITGNQTLNLPSSWATNKVGTYDGAKRNLFTVSYMNIGGTLEVDVLITQMS